MNSSVSKRAGLANLGLLCLSVTISLLIVEFAVRAMFGEQIVLFPRNHAAARYGDYVIRRLTPNYSFWHESVDGRWQFKTNGQGFRADRDYIYEKPLGVLRVLVLGDSHTQGFEVQQQEVFTAQLEKRLRKRGVNIEVLNAGVSGFGTAEELVFLENEGLRYKPDVVVVAFFANDFEDTARSRLFRLEDGKLLESSKVYAPAVGIIRWTQLIPGLKWLGENSYAYSMLFNGVWDFMKTLSAREATREYAVKVSATSSTAEDLTAALLARLAASAQRNGCSAILVDIPQAKGKEAYTSSIQPEFRSRVAPAFQHVLLSEHYLRDLPEGRSAHVPHGHRHINAEAHARLAETLEGLLATQGSAGPTNAQKVR